MTLAIDVSGLVELVWIAPLCAVLVTVSYSLCVLGATRSSDARRVGDSAASTAWLALACLAGLAVGAQVVFGFGIIAGFWGSE
jgi:hypothetical protein